MTSRRFFGRLPAAYAALAGAALLAWWAVALVDLAPAALRPPELRAGHVVAEVVLGIALLAGAWLDRRRTGWLLSAALGGLTYAALNVLGEYPDAPWLAVVLILVATCSAFLLFILARRGLGRPIE